MAVKIIDKNFVAGIPNFQQNMDRELQVISKLKHRNIINFIEVKPTKNNYYYVLELCEGQELKKMLETRGRLSELEAQKLFK